MNLRLTFICIIGTVLLSFNDEKHATHTYIIESLEYNDSLESLSAKIDFILILSEKANHRFTKRYSNILKKKIKGEKVRHGLLCRGLSSAHYFKNGNVEDAYLINLNSDSTKTFIRSGFIEELPRSGDCSEAGVILLRLDSSNYHKQVSVTVFAAPENRNLVLEKRSHEGMFMSMSTDANCYYGVSFEDKPFEFNKSILSTYDVPVYYVER